MAIDYKLDQAIFRRLKEIDRANDIGYFNSGDFKDGGIIDMTYNGGFFVLSFRYKDKELPVAGDTSKTEMLSDRVQRLHDAIVGESKQNIPEDKRDGVALFNKRRVSFHGEYTLARTLNNAEPKPEKPIAVPEEDQAVARINLTGRIFGRS